MGQGNTFQFEEDFFANFFAIAKIFNEVLLILKFLQTKHQSKSMKINNDDCIIL